MQANKGHLHAGEVRGQDIERKQARDRYSLSRQARGRLVKIQKDSKPERVAYILKRKEVRTGWVTGKGKPVWGTYMLERVEVGTG